MYVRTDVWTKMEKSRVGRPLQGPAKIYRFLNAFCLVYIYSTIPTSKAFLPSKKSSHFYKSIFFSTGLIIFCSDMMDGGRITFSVRESPNMGDYKIFECALNNR